MQCDAACLTQARLAPGQYKARDLYSRKDVVITSDSGGTFSGQ